MQATQYSLRYKIIAWILTLCLAITLIPDIGYAAAKEQKQADIKKKPIAAENLTESDVIEKDVDSTTYDMGGGKKMTVFHGGQVRYENDKGELEDYDPSLEKLKSGEKSLQKKSLKGYSYTNKNGDKKHYIPDSISEDTPIRMEYKDYAVEFTPKDTILAQMQVTDNSIEVENQTMQTAYKDDEVLPVNAVYGSDDDKVILTYTSTGEGIKETLVLEEKPANNVFTYKLKLTGMTARKNILDEGITFFDKETELITGFISAPWMNDATGKAYSEAITYDIQLVEGTEDEYILTMTIDKGYLSDKDRRYPVTVDPSVTWQGTSNLFDAYVISGSKYGNTNFYSSETKVMPVGVSSNGTNRTYIHFNSLQDTITGNDIESAIFTAYENASSKSGQKVGLYRVTANWSARTITYNNRPGLGTCYATSTTKGVTNTAHTFNVTAFATAVEAHTISNYGLQLSNQSSGYACFFGSRASSYKPKLVVTYATAPAAPTGVSLSSSYVNNSTAAKLNFTKPSNAARVEYKIVAYNDATQTEGSVITNFSSSTAITTGSSLPSLDEGCYKIYIRGVNSAGTAGTAASAGILHVDCNIPTFESMAFKDSAGESIAGTATAETNPLIEFTGVTDTHIDSSCITYAIQYEGVEPGADEYKTPADLSINSSKPYSGSFRLTADDRTLPSGNYTISVKVKDLAGNECIKKFGYNRDSEDPTGSIAIFDMTTGNAVDSFSKPVNLEVTVDGTGSDIKESSLKLYKATTDSSGNITGTDAESEVLIDKNFTMSENIVFDTLDLCDSYGKYRLVLYIKDGVGRTKEVTKDFTVSYVLSAPDKAEISYSTGGIADFTWSFPYNAQQKIKLNSIWAKFGESGEFQQIVAPGEDGTLPFEDTAQVTVPTEEGTYDVQIYGKSNDGSVGAIKTVTCVVDKTAPVVEIEGLNQNYLTGIIYDDNISDWQIYIKDKVDASFPEEPIEKGIYAMGFIYEEYRNVSPLCYIDFSSDEYEPGHEYTVKIVASDNAGHKSEATLDIVSPSTEFMPNYIPAELEVEEVHPLWTSGHFILGPTNGTLTLKGGVTDATWYINNRKASPEIVDPNGNLTQGEGWWHDFLAVTKDQDGNRKYTVDRIENGLCQTVSFTADEITGNVGEKHLDFYSSGIAFQIVDAPTGAIYEISPDAMDEELQYFTVEPNRIYYVDELYSNSVFSNALNVRVTAAEGQNIQDIQFKIYSHNIVNQHFMYSEADYYTPQNLRVESKINHKTYIKWDIEGELPENISYDVYRSTDPDFYPSMDTLVAEGLRTGYYTEMNVAQDEVFYYKVCAVKKVPLAVDGDITLYDYYYSPYMEVEGVRSVDQNEFLKRLGMKDFWQFTEFNTPNGNGYVEKSKGNFLYQQKDAEIPNEGFEVGLTRTYNSQSSSSGVFGFGWTHDYDMELLNICENNSTEFTHVVLKDGNGTLYHFTRDPGEQYFVSSLGSYVNLTAETTEQTKEVIISGLDTNNTVSLKYQFVLSTSDGVKYYFNSGGQLILMEDGNEKFVIFEYDAKMGVLSKMVTNNNSTIEFVYNDLTTNSTMLTVKEIRMPDGSKVQYEYTKPSLVTEQLLTKVTKVASDGSSTVSYEYEYENGILSTQPKNLTVIKDATGEREYKINYDFSEDQVSDVVYPNNEKFTFDYAADNTYTIVKKFSGGQVVLGEKEFFDRVYGKCEKSIRGVENTSQLEGTDETGLDVTTYEYRDHLITSTTMTAEYREVNSDGYVVEKTGTKTAKADYAGDQPTKETEEDGTVSEYTYYDDTSGENLAGQIKTVRETNANGKTVGYKKYAYDDALNTTQVIDYVAGTKIVNTYYTEGAFKGELHTMQEYLLNVTSTFEVTGESLQSTSTYTYENVITDGATTKVESCTQVLPKPDGTSETITISSTYDSMGRKLKEIDSRGYQTINTYDAFGRVTATTYKYSNSDTLKQSTSTSYDANNMITYEKLADGTEKWYTYDEMYRVVAAKVKKGDKEETITTTYGYEDVDIYQGKGNNTVSVNNAYVTTQSYSDGIIISKTYEDHKGNLVRVYSGGLYTDMTYNSQGEMITKWVMGKTLSATDGVLQLFIHDDKGNLTQTITDPDYIAGTETTGYKVREDSTTEDGVAIQGSIVTKSTYDSDGNVTSTTDAEGNTTAYTYDRLGNLTSVLQPDNVKYEYQYDVQGTNGTTKDIVLEPRVTGNDAGRSMSKSVVTKDATDKVIKVEDFGTSDTDDTSISTSYEYDVRDNLIKSIEKNGNYKLYTYDSRDRVTSFDYYEMSGDTAVKTLRTEFTYDDSDNITSMTDKEVAADGTETVYRYSAYGYDGFNRLTYVSECDTDAVPTEAEIDANKVRYEYDIKDRLISIDYPDSHEGIIGLRFSYDSNNWLQNVTAVHEDKNTKSLLRTYTYDNYGRTSEITDYPDTVNSTSKWIKRVFTYDKLDRTTGIEYYDNMSGSSTDIKACYYYTYDKNSNITKEEYTNLYGDANDAVYGEERHYAYDANGRLFSASMMENDSGDAQRFVGEYGYTYDAAGNRVQEYFFGPNEGEETVQDYTYNEFNQLTASTVTDLLNETTTSKTYAYDANGNQIRETGSDGTQTTYTYDAANRLKTATGKTGETVDYIQTNRYNGYGQRVEKSETIGTSTDTTNYFYDGSQILYTTNGSSNVTSFNMVGAEDNIILTGRPGDTADTDPSFYVYTKDIRESTTNVIGTDGTAAVSYSYDTFGETTEYQQDENDPFYNEICYTAGVYDKTTGLYNLSARYYSPDTGTFLTQDTYRGSRSRTATLNYYAYCAGNPVSYTDPSGHAFWAVAGAAMGAYDGYQYAKKKNLKGWKKGAAIVGGALIGAVNPFKIVGKAVKVAKAVKTVKTAKKATKSAKALKAVTKTPKKTVVTKKVTKVATAGNKTVKTTGVVKAQGKTVKGACFVAGTKVSTDKGFVSIEKIKPGDYVWSENPETNEKALKKVNKIFVREKDSIVRLSINGKIIETTDEHPFYVEGKGFVGAGALNYGDEVRLQSGDTATVDGIDIVQLVDPIKVYNFEVEDFHTYYVSEQEVLVHNTCVEPVEKSTNSKYWTKSKYVNGKKVYQREDLINPDLVDSRGRTNIQRMEKGLAPIGDDGKPINLHHMTQTNDGAIAEMTATFHQKNSRIIHINPNTIPSGIDRKAFNKWRREYWKARVKDFE